MIKVVISRPGSGGPMLLLGLTEANVARLQAGEPLFVDLTGLGWKLTRLEKPQGSIVIDSPPGQVLLVMGKDEKSLAGELGYEIENPKPGEVVKGRPAPRDPLPEPGAN